MGAFLVTVIQDVLGREPPPSRGYLAGASVKQDRRMKARFWAGFGFGFWGGFRFRVRWGVGLLRGPFRVGLSSARGGCRVAEGALGSDEVWVGWVG